MDPTSFSPKYCASVINCSRDPNGASCDLSPVEFGKRDVMATLRLLMATLSILGTLSIIISVIRKKQVFNPKIHPILMLSIADFLLAIMWVVGGGLWINGGNRHKNHSRVRCFVILLVTVIVECVTVNLTCVYALLAYSSIKKKDFSNVYSLFEKNLDKHAWKPWRTILAYTLSWILPVILIMVPFSVVAKAYNLVKQANSCSCWCFPYFGNLVPTALSGGNDTLCYLHHLNMFIASYSIILAGTYLFGFILLVIVYWKTLKIIGKMKDLHRNQGRTDVLTETVITKGQTQAKIRVVYFLTVFIISGFFNLFLSLLFVAYESHLLYNPTANFGEKFLPMPVFAMYISQSITVPIQGFLNAIVYGWTREDFVSAVAFSPNSSSIQDSQQTSLLRGQSQTLSSDYEHNNPLMVDSSMEVDDTTQGRSLVGQDMLFSIPEQ